MKYQRILFVCSGNQCRSPIAEVIFKDMVIKDPALSAVGIEVKAAGTLLGIDGVPPTNKAIQVMGERGLDISSHRAKHENPHPYRSAQRCAAGALGRFLPRYRLQI